jgi:hypothetical protein
METQEQKNDLTPQEAVNEEHKRWEEFRIASEPLQEFLAKYSKDIMSVGASCYNGQWRIMNVYWIGENLRSKS